MYSRNESEQDLLSSNHIADTGSYYFSTSGIDSPCESIYPDSVYEHATRQVKYTTSRYASISVAFSSYMFGFLELFQVLLILGQLL